VTRAQLSEGADGVDIDIEDCEGTLKSAEELLDLVIDALDSVNMFKPDKEGRS